MCQKAFYYFLDFMISNWGYLLLNNRDYWLDHLPRSANSIRMKLATLPNETYREFFDDAEEPGGFCVFGFIDNTMFAFCRPGGGPIRDGEQSPRVPKIVQQAWYTGWKKLHGMKWQTVILANGMDFEVWGPASVRHPDAYTLNHSNIEEKLEILQRNKLLKYKMYGDSAYFDDDFMVTGGGCGLSSVRETIEWSYKDIKVQWKYLNFKYCLTLKNQPLAKIVFACMLLRNVLCTLYADQTADYFVMLPPEFEEWISQGPQGRPLPEDSIFHPNFHDDANDGNSSSSDSSDGDDEDD
jgi:hypothetical protein